MKSCGWESFFKNIKKSVLNNMEKKIVCQESILALLIVLIGNVLLMSIGMIKRLMKTQGSTPLIVSCVEDILKNKLYSTRTFLSGVFGHLPICLRLFVTLMTNKQPLVHYVG